MSIDEPVRAAIRELVAERGPDKSCCPSEVARRLDADCWRERMAAVHAAAAALAEAGEIEVSQRGRAVDARKACGPIRLCLRSVGPPA